MRTHSSSDRYYWLKEHGICVNCGCVEAEPNRTMCFDCAERARSRDKKYRIKKKNDNPNYLKERAASDRDRYNRHKANGICVRCAKKATHGMYCYEHFIRERRRSINRAQQQRNERHDRGLIPEYRSANGLCFYCGNPIEDYLKKTGCKACAACREKISAISSEHNRNHPWRADNRLIFRKQAQT